MKSKVILVTCLFLTINVMGQQVRETVNINNDDTKAVLRTVIENAGRSRTFYYNPKLRQLTATNIGDTLQLDFFENLKYKAVITDVTVGYDDVLGITARVTDHDFASCIVSVSESGISLRADIPGNSEQYRIVNTNGYTVLSQYTYSEDCFVLRNDEMLNPNRVLNPVRVNIPQPPQLSTLNSQRSTDSLSEHITIDVMVVYSTKAKEWAEKNATSIDNAISMAFQYANHVLENSQVNLTFRMVHKYETDYAESKDANADLMPFRDQGDGIMDEVHDLRREYGADLVVLMPMTGAWAFLPNYNLNKPDPTFAFSVCNVGGSTYGATLIHELAHNLGAHHHWQQLRDKYPGPGIFTYSSAWRGVGKEGNWYHTVMSYDGDSFADKNTSVMIPYLSNPEVIVNGVPIGKVQKEDNALTLNQTKHVIARYSELIGSKNPPTSMEKPENNRLKAYAANGILHISGLKVGETFTVVNLAVQVIYHGIATANETSVSLSTGGIYIITAGSSSIKTIVGYAK